MCTTCRRGDEPAEPKDSRSGAKFFAAIAEAASGRADLVVQPVECLLNCNHGCNIALRADGKWSYHFGDLDPGEQVAHVLALADMHGNAQDGEVPWGKRPEAIKRKAISRIPPAMIRKD